MNDPVTQIATALAMGAAEKFASSAAKRLWAKIKEWTKSKKPEGTAILEYFADDPDHMVDAIRRLLQDTRAADSQEILSLAREILKHAGPSQTAIGRHVVQAGGDVGTVIQADRLNVSTLGITSRRTMDKGDFDARIKPMLAALEYEVSVVPEDRVMGMHFDRWWEATDVLSGAPKNGLLLTSGGAVVGVPLVRALPWRGLRITDQRILARAVQGDGRIVFAEDHPNGPTVQVECPSATCFFVGPEAEAAMSRLKAQGLVQHQGGVAYELSADGRGRAQAILGARGEDWLHEGNPDCQEMFLPRGGR